MSGIILKGLLVFALGLLVIILGHLWSGGKR